MTKYKKLVKKRSLRYKNCKTHRRKGRKAGAGGTWRRRIGNLLGTGRVSSLLHRVGAPLARRTRRRTESPTITMHNLSTHVDDLRTLYGTWRNDDALNTAIRLGERACSILDDEIRHERIGAEVDLKEVQTRGSVSLNEPEISSHTAIWIYLIRKYILLIKRLETIAHSVWRGYFHIRSKNKDKSLEKHFIVDIQEYKTLVTRIKDIEQQIEEILDQIDEDICPVLPYNEAIKQLYGNNYDKDYDDKDNDDKDDDDKDDDD
uniref:Uncharacterized protein n=1 Tax=viral metagenome TaxID=1070528 RepID=A0A6C0H3Y4_9ZZZZ